MKEQAVELKNKVHLSPDKVLNPGNVGRYEGITPDTPVLVVLAAGKGTRFGTNPKCRAVPGIFSTNCHIFREIGKLFVYGKGNKNSGC